MLDQPAGHLQPSQRPLRADHVEVDVGAVAGDDVAKVFLVSERQDGAATASTGGFRHKTSGVGTGAMAIASTSTSVRP